MKIKPKFTLAALIEALIAVLSIYALMLADGLDLKLKKIHHAKVRVVFFKKNTLKFYLRLFLVAVFCALSLKPLLEDFSADSHFQNCYEIFHIHKYNLNQHSHSHSEHTGEHAEDVNSLYNQKESDCYAAHNLVSTYKISYEFDFFYPQKYQIAHLKILEIDPFFNSPFLDSIKRPPKFS